MNRKYYIVLPYQRKGPYNIEELKQIGITPETLIWAFEYDEPIKAKDIADLQSILITEQKKEDTEISPDITNENIEAKEEKKEAIADNFNEDLKKEEKITPSAINENIEPKDKEEETEDELSEDLNKENIPENQLEEKTEPENIEITEETNSEKILDEKVKEEPVLDGNNLPPAPPIPVTYNKEEQKEENTYQEIRDKDVFHNKPKDYIVWSVVSIFFCFSFFGIISLITGIITNNNFNKGNYEAAEKMSKATLYILIFGFIISILTYIIIFAYALKTS